MKKLIPVCLVTIALLVGFSTTPVFAHDYEGWDTIRPLLKDGAGDEFVKPVGLPADYFTDGTELEAVQSAAQWVATNMAYAPDLDAQGTPTDIWTSSNEMYTRLTGDCEDYAILLCALLRFHTQGGIPSNRVWVVVGLITLPGTDQVVAGHGWVAYKLQKGGMTYIEPQTGTIHRGNLGGGMLNFNDQWVKGGGFYLAGP